MGDGQASAVTCAKKFPNLFVWTILSELWTTTTHEPGDYLLNAPLLFSISRIKVKFLALTKVNPSQIFLWTCPCLHHHPLAYPDPKSYNHLWLLSLLFPFVQRGNILFKSSFIIADRFPNFCPYPLFLENSRHSWLFCLQLFSAFVYLSDELGHMRQVTADCSFRSQERELGVGNSWKTDYGVNWLGRSLAPQILRGWAIYGFPTECGKEVTRHFV